MGEIISFSNQKGGVGKTTTCVNMASYLAKFGKKVLLVDIDPQGNATTGLGFDKSTVKNSVYNLLIDDADVLDVIKTTEIPNLDLMPSSIELAAAEVEIVYLANREKILYSKLSRIKDSYDYICIDCPPSLGLLTINALAASNGVIIPIQCEYYALEGLSQLMNSIKLVIKHLNKNLQISGVALTMFDGRALVSKQIASEIRGFFKQKVFNTVIPRNIRVSEAPSHGVPVMLHDPKCAGAKAYQDLTKEFIERSEN